MCVKNDRLINCSYWSMRRERMFDLGSNYHPWNRPVKVPLFPSIWTTRSIWLWLCSWKINRINQFLKLIRKMHTRMRQIWEMIWFSSKVYSTEWSAGVSTPKSPKRTKPRICSIPNTSSRWLLIWEMINKLCAPDREPSAIIWTHWSREMKMQAVGSNS